MEIENDNIFLNFERELNSNPLVMRKQLISEQMHHELRTTGAQTVCLHDLAKVHKIDTPLRPFLSVPGRRYHNLNSFLAPISEK